MMDNSEILVYRAQGITDDMLRSQQRGELRLCAEAALAQAAQRRRFSERVLAGTGDFLIWLGERLKKGARVESPAAI